MSFASFSTRSYKFQISQTAWLASTERILSIPELCNLTPSLYCWKSSHDPLGIAPNHILGAKAMASPRRPFLSWQN